MPEMTKVEKPKIAGFVDSRYSSKDRTEKEEKELNELLAEQNQETNSSEESEENTSGKNAKEKDVQGEAVGKEEESFKKRYGDLRRHLADKEKDWTKRLETLEAQHNKATKNELILPKTEEEIDAWAKEYPDVAGIVETIASKKARESSAELEKRLQEIETLRESAKKEKAEAELLALHPDFDKIRESDEFHNWAEEQPKWVQDALYDNADDAKSAARVIDLYKSDNNIVTDKKRNNDKAAASAIRPSRSRSTPQADATSSYLKESDVNKMSAQEYEKKADTIMEAIRSGKFVYDISGAAR